MTAAERDALIERAMERLHRLREKEAAEPTHTNERDAFTPSGVVKGAR